MANSPISFYLLKTPRSVINSPMKKQKGLRGKNRKSKTVVNQKRSLISHWTKYNSSSYYFQKKPKLLYTTRLFLEKKTQWFFFKSARGLLSIHKNINAHLFSFYLSKFGAFIPKFVNCVYSKHLIFYKINSKLINIRDLFNDTPLTSTSFKSISILKNIDWWLGFAVLILPSNKIKLFFYLSKAEIGFFNFLGLNLNNRFRAQWDLNWRKAGLSSNLGKKPKVRGVAKNPVDHPHGGRTKSIRFQRTPWGKPTKLK